MADFNDYLSALKTELPEFVTYSWKNEKTAALKDARAFMQEVEADLQRWTALLASGDLTRDDFEWLVAGKKDLAELNALKRKGLSRVALERFVNGLIDTIVTTAFKVFL
jgi:hypothetical protein